MKTWLLRVRELLLKTTLARNRIHLLPYLLIRPAQKQQLTLVHLEQAANNLPSQYRVVLRSFCEEQLANVFFLRIRAMLP